MSDKFFTSSILSAMILLGLAGCSMLGSKNKGSSLGNNGTHQITDEIQAVSGYSMFVSYDEPDTIAQKHNASIAKKANRLCRNGYDEINRSKPKASKRSTDSPIGGYTARGPIPFSTVSVVIRCR